MTDKGLRQVLYASGGHANLRLVSDEKCDWLRAAFGVELTDAPSCRGRFATAEEERLVPWAKERWS